MRALWTRAWIIRHVSAAGLVAAFLALGWWQIGRAAAGNALSWAYAVEWPVFAGFVALVWAAEVRRDLRDHWAPVPPPDTSPPADLKPSETNTELPGAGPSVRRPVQVQRRPAAVPDDDPELAAYNAYLAWLAAHPGARPSDYPG